MNLEEMDFLHLEKKDQLKLFEKMGLSTRSASMFRTRQRKKLSERLKEIDEKCYSGNIQSLTEEQFCFSNILEQG